MPNHRLVDLLTIPEIAGLDARRQLIRIPPDLDVPLTPRVRKIIDTPDFHRLSKISQLGLVALVYPGARHSRFEHSLGVYRLALLFLKRLANDTRFAALVSPDDASLLIAAALLHDLGHWPGCHLIEDLHFEGIPPHESIARRFITSGPLAEILEKDWNLNPCDVADLLEEKVPLRKENESDLDYLRRNRVFHLLESILSGPIDIDKMDYLPRDSHACGVPYGRHFDQERLIGSLCLNEKGDGLALLDKGKTAAELMVFARYVMFSEVYWHRTVRAATVMFQRAFTLLYDLLPNRQAILDGALTLPFGEWLRTLRAAAAEMSDEKARQNGAEAFRLLDALFGNQRAIYKRVRNFSVMTEPELYRKLAGSPYALLSQKTSKLIQKINEKVSFSEKNGTISQLGPHDLLIDAPPIAKEVEFKIDIYFQGEDLYRPLHQVSPVIRALAAEQFDHYVKRVRLFASEKFASRLRNLPDLNDWVAEISDQD